MNKRLDNIEKRHKELETLIMDPNLVKDPKLYKKTTKEYSELGEVVRVYEEFKKTITDLEETENLLKKEKDLEMIELIREDLASLREKKALLDAQISELLLPKNEDDDKNTIMEIRAGTGGDEASLFCYDLFRMYSRYVERKGWKLEVLSMSEASGNGGLKEVVFMVTGSGAYGTLKFESGGHRVQRIPQTEANGRIHTSACTVAVLKEADDIEIDIKDADIRIDVSRASGNGGQSVNTTDSAVRITHLATGIVVHCQDEKSQHKNKAKALKILKARILEMEEEKQAKEISDNRKTQIGSGDRSQRIRTYNFPQNRLTEHRINLTLYSLSDVMMGEIDEIISELRKAEKDQKLQDSSNLELD